MIRLLLGLALAGVTACSIQHRSDGFTCAPGDDCGPGRICSEGFCVLAGTIDAARADAPRGDGGAPCPAPCTSCNTAQKVCTIDCTKTNCNDLLTCPSGYKCDIQCNVEGSCRKGINCLLATSCSIECSARNTCEAVQCGPGPCSVACSGPSSCKNVSCGNSCACDVLCTGNQSCAQGIQCSSLACKTATGGCTSVPSFCNSCN
jgi:hypothetical protein